jgi:ribosome-binding factor A
MADLYDRVKDELRRRANRLLAREAHDPALQTTVLVDEVLLKLV